VATSRSEALVPLHIWLPEAHPVAPADGSAFLSGLVITLGVFGIALFGFELLPGGPAWWGLVTIGLGALSASLGILYGLMERDLKRFLAYSSIENNGIVLTCVALGVGAPWVLSALDRSARATTGTDIHAVLLLAKLTVIPAHTNFSGF
jgi:hydrogenase-4 component B